jgi:hypothetical protein
VTSWGIGDIAGHRRWASAPSTGDIGDNGSIAGASVGIGDIAEH